MTPLSEVERHIHFVVRERLAGFCQSGPKCRGALLSDLLAEMKKLKEELDNYKYSKLSFGRHSLSDMSVRMCSMLILNYHSTIINPEMQSTIYLNTAFTKLKRIGKYSGIQ